MSRKRPPNPNRQALIGVAVIAFGILFLLDNLGILDFRYSFQFWPVMLILAGALRLSQTQTESGKITGGLLVAAGCVLLLKGMGLLYVSWSTLGPLVLIGVGVAVVCKSVEARKRAERKPDGVAPERSRVNLAKDGAGPAATGMASEQADDDSIISATAILGGFERRIVTRNFQGGEVTAMMGGCELDLRQSSINGDAVINVFALCGGITLKVPPDWTVILQGTPILGGFDEKTATPPDGSKRLYIRGYAIMGGLEVRN